MSLNVPQPADKANPTQMPLSKTCQNCFLLKIRCDRTQRTDICDRCARLGKTCVFRPARRRDHSAKRDSRIQALEAQVQQLLRTQAPTTSSPTETTVSPTPIHAPNPTASTTSPASTSSLIIPSDSDVVEAGIVSDEQAHDLVELYKANMMPHYPFVVVPPQTIAKTLRTDKPFLFLAVLATASYGDIQLQETLSTCFQQLVSARVLLGGDDCLALEYLQGLLIVLAWNQYHARSKFFSQYLQLAISIAVDLRLDRKPLRPKNATMSSKRDVLARNHTENWGAEEQRAAAGCFYLSSTISKLFDKMNTFPCTRYIEEGCLSLQQKCEYQSDRYLYHVIRLQRLIENVESLSLQSPNEVDAQSSFMRLKSDLEQFRTHLSADVAESHLLHMQFYTAKLFLYQVAFFERSLHTTPHSPLHVQTLREGLQSVQSFLNLYLWLPPKAELNLTNMEWIQLSFGLTLAAKLAIVSTEPNVEQQTRDLRHLLNMPNMFQHFSSRIGQLLRMNGEEGKKKDIFAFYGLRVRQVQSWFDKISAATRNVRPDPTKSQAYVTTQAPLSAPPPSQVTKPSPPMQTHSAVPVNPMVYGHSPHASIPALPSVPVAYSQTSPPQYTQPSPPVYVAAPHQYGPSTPNGSIIPPNTTDWSNVPTIAFPDLMADPGWQMPFAIPMEEDQFAYAFSQGFGGGYGSPEIVNTTYADWMNTNPTSF